VLDERGRIDLDHNGPGALRPKSMASTSNNARVLMTGRNLEYLLKPASVALIGASDRPSSLGAAILRNLRDAAFAGPIMLVNPKYAEIGGARCYASIADLPAAPDLAVLVTPPNTVPASSRHSVNAAAKPRW
jgi:acyl-CoA synthetase (NDP forming)